MRSPVPRRLRVVMLSDFQSRMDEGVNNIAYHMARYIAQRHDLQHVCLRPYRRLLRPGFWHSVRRHQPDIIHFVPGPTLKSFLLVKALKHAWPRAKTVMSAAHPAFSGRAKAIIRHCAPDLVLVQSLESEQIFSDLQFRTAFVPGAVDGERFYPVSAEVKRQLRKKYSLPENEWIVLHIGPLKRGRNMLALKSLAPLKVKVVVIGSLTVPGEDGVKGELEAAGCIVWHRYFENVNEVYNMADCYVFPTMDRDNCVETPLSVLEAMACNLPVVSTRFRALPHMFDEGDGLSFVDDGEEIVEAVRRIKGNGAVPNTRAKVLQFTWDRVGEKIEQAYQQVAS